MATLLLVEDHELNRDMLSRRLTRSGYSVLTAEDGRQGVETAIRSNPDLILMDLSLPVMDGWEATRLLKGDERTKSIPVIALTAHAMFEETQRALAAGCDDIDTKPVDYARLLGKIQSALRLRTENGESR